MSDDVAKELIRTTPQIVTGIGAIFASFFAYRSLSYSKKASQNSEKVIEQTNGLKTELVALTQKASFAEGKLEGATQALPQHIEVTMVPPTEPKA